MRQSGLTREKCAEDSGLFPVNSQSIAGYVALTGETVNLPDASLLKPRNATKEPVF